MPITIPHTLAQKGDLVIIPRSEYDALREERKVKTFAPSKTLPKDWELWMTNENDGTVEGIRQKNSRLWPFSFIWKRRQAQWIRIGFSMNS